MTDSKPKLGIIAGGGPLPARLAQHCKSEGRECLVLGIEGEAVDVSAQFPFVWVGIASVGRTLKILKKEECREIVFIGPVSRPDFSALTPDWKGMTLLPRFIRAARGGDDGLLKVVIAAFEEEGFRVVGADDVMSDLLGGEDALSRKAPTDDDQRDIDRGVAVVQTLGQLDIGQGCVVCNEYILAVEAAEGTDNMLRRCADLSVELRGTPEARRGVFVKISKPGQEGRIDRPTIGVRTVELAALAGLSGIAYETGKVLIADPDAVREKADDLGLFVTGVSI